LPKITGSVKFLSFSKDLYAQYPDEWQTVRRIVVENYLVYADYNKYAWPPIDANLMGIAV